ncbi:MAG: lysozyme inhibitor LprI family protein [Maricaulaceae bacterium]|jgi:uncharacterized protein YecT (DUF1311 family)
MDRSIFALTAGAVLVAGCALASAAAFGQTPDDVGEQACADPALDAISQRACYARTLSDVESELADALSALRDQARTIEAADRRRGALAAIDGAHNAWRLLRDQDCQLRAALEREPTDASLVQMQCAIRRTSARLFDVTAFSASAPPIEVAAEETEAPADDAVPAAAEDLASNEAETADAADIAAAADFRDWRATCRPGGACAASAATGDNDAAYALRIERADAREDWSIHLASTDARTHAEAPIRIEIDRLEPVEFQPRTGFAVGANAADVTFLAPMKTAAVFSGMRAGLNLTAVFTDANGVERAEQFSLRGLSAALDWIDAQQAP